MLKTLVAIALIVPSLRAQSIAALSLEQQEEFLRVAAVKQVRGAKKGVTGHGGRLFPMEKRRTMPASNPSMKSAQNLKRRKARR